MATTSTECSYTMCLEFYAHEGGPRIHEEPLGDADFERARSAASWEGFRNGRSRCSEFDPGGGLFRIEPLFANRNGGSPRALGFTIEIEGGEGARHRTTFAVDHFEGRARRAAGELVRLGKVADGTTLHYALAASPTREDAGAAAPALFTLDGATSALPVRPGLLQSLPSQGAWDSPRPGEFPVLIHRQVITDALAEAAAAPENEAGGFLLGHLRRDSESNEVFLQVTALVPAQYTEATAASVTFTPESWAHMRSMTELRGEGEILAGWMHSHPFRFCAECPVPAPAECIAKILFFSRDDEFVMNAAFPQPFMVGLVAGVEPRLEAALGHPPVRLFGWERGLIRARGFHVFGD
jgi:proteasome lid subunit RPN8/RPN11